MSAAMKVKIRKCNRAGRKRLPLRNPDTPGNPRKIVVYYDDLSKAKKPPAWMKELLFGEDAA